MILLHEGFLHAKTLSCVSAHRKNKANIKRGIGRFGMMKILFVCHGNICRSPMAEFVLRDMLKKASLESTVEVASAATSAEELGNPVHRGTRQVLSRAGIRCDGKTACRLRRDDYEAYDWLIGMDEYNIRNMRTMLGGDPQGKLVKLLSFCAEDGDVADPWYTGDFEQTYRDVTRGCKGIIDMLTRDCEQRKKD